MQPNLVKQALAAGQLQLGTNFGQFRSSEIPRLLAAAGFKWAFIDTEHGGFDLETVQDICRVSRLAGLCPIVRVADLQYSLIARSLDCGAQGIIFPRIEDPRLLENALTWTRFPPAGVRGYGLQPSQVDYEPLAFGDVIEHLNANTINVLQIESVHGVEARDEILSVPGIDAVLVGPADLSISMGIPGDFQNPRLIEAIELVRDTCNRKGIAPGVHTRTIALARFWKDRGMKFLSCGSDVSFLWDKASETAKGVLA
jgi:2-dehydro-3-deoxyglucarate aldolase/4-hydroxy-2-oxoheptanedioate aldolase